MKTPVEIRFWRWVNKDGPISPYCPHLGNCWLYTGAKNKGGYGMIWGRNCKELAHRIAYWIETGVMPDEQVQHWCNNPACVRFSHFYLGDHKINAEYKVLCGRMNQPEGSDHYESHFSDEKVRQLRAEWTPGQHGRPKKGTCPNSVRALAKREGVAENAMRCLLYGKTYKNVK